MKNCFKRIMLITLSIILLLVGVVYLFLQQTQFGKQPTGKRLERIKKSPNYRDGAFKNQHYTPDLSEDATYFGVFKEFLFTKKERLKPIDTIPSTKTNLHALQKDENVLIWFGHSSYFMQLDGKAILVDPVFSGAASPISFTTPAFNGTDIYDAEDFPTIDYLFISHDHWDHLDYSTVLKLKSKVKQVITGLGTGEHFEYWGFDANTIIEEDWNTEIKLDSGFIVTTTPARHFAGRGFKRNQTLWTSFVLQTPTMKIYIGGDSGYDTHFAEIGKQHGPFDLAILENGQYDKSWKYIHMMPKEVVKAALNLRADRLLPVHSSKFSLSNHSWDEPLKRVTVAARAVNLPLITPIIGEKVVLTDSTKSTTAWWLTVN